MAEAHIEQVRRRHPLTPNATLSLSCLSLALSLPNREEAQVALKS
jgi:hypothetical protein